MEDKQFDILMKTIGGINTRLDKLEESTEKSLKEINTRLNGLEEAQKNTMDEQIKGFDRLEKMFREYARINEKDHSMYMAELGKRYIELKDENEDIRADLNALHFLSKENEVQHKEYDERLSIKRN